MQNKFGRVGILISLLKVVVAVAGIVTALVSTLFFVRLRWPAAIQWVLKLFASALAYVFVSIGALCFVIGMITGSTFLSIVGFYDALIFSIHIFRVTRPPVFSSGFKNTFGTKWEQKLSDRRNPYFLRSRTLLRLPAVPSPLLQQDIPFANIPGTDRRLVCDVWQPHKSTRRSGLAFIYLHGSAWFFLDKDLGTRPFFSHLVAQGHVIMDVAYRLAPETDMMGMIHDVKRAIAWMKENAGTYEIEPEKIVLGGGSAGGHLALMAAYTANNAAFIPKDLQGEELSVDSVISLYGPTELTAMYYHTNQHRTTRKIPGQPQKAAPTQMPGWIRRRMGKDYYRLKMDKGFANAGAFVSLFGGHPDECPEIYSLYSPITHLSSKCPPTLLIHGEDDVMAPVATTRMLHDSLAEKNVPVVMLILPQTDHAFDLILPKISPSAHNAIYDIERFLALRAEISKRPQKMDTENEEHQWCYA